MEKKILTKADAKKLVKVGKQFIGGAGRFEILEVEETRNGGEGWVEVAEVMTDDETGEEYLAENHGYMVYTDFIGETIQVDLW